MPDAADRARARLVAELAAGGRVRTPRVRDALAAVPRHTFLPALPVADAYRDEAVAIKVEDDVTVSSVSQPSMVAIMLEQLGALPGDRVLEVGAGAGWNAALLAHIVGPSGAVTTLDIDDDLVRDARAHLDAAGFAAVHAVTADGAGGHAPGAPYDRIELTVGATDVRPEWVAQLVPDGRLVLPLSVRGSQLSVAFRRVAPDRLTSVSVRSCAFVRLRGAGADPSGPLRLATPGWTAQVPGPGGPVAALLDDALARPAADVLDCPGAGPAPDVWDGLGLWCALADPAVFRLSATGPAADGPVGRSLPPGPAGRAGVGLADDDGFALLLGDPPGAVREFGDGTGATASRLVALVAGWVAAGRPHAADLRIEAVVGAIPEPVPPVSPAAAAPRAGSPGLSGVPELPGAPEPPVGPGLDVVVRTGHAVLRVRMP